MPYRKTVLAEGEIYHIFTKSIAGFKVFNSHKDFQRMLGTINFYVIEKPPCKYSSFLALKNKDRYIELNKPNYSEKIVKIIAYCLMPTHIHLVIQQLKNNGISRFTNLILKSYSKYFNLKYKRKGPLWEGRFKNVLVETDEQFLHLTRYIHLNPTSASLINNPLDWEFSSYKEYIGLVEEDKKICDFSNYMNMNASLYQRFVNDRIDYQRELERIKHLILE